MQHFRSNLTRLKTLMSEKLPEEKDLYGYDGVSKEALMTAIESAYTLSHEITVNDESRFEVISLKRAGSDLYKSLKDFFDLDDRGSKQRQRFNDFLNDLSKLIEKTRITYFIVAKNGLRDEEELSNLRTRVAEMTLFSTDIENITIQLKEKFEQISKMESSIVAIFNTVNKQKDDISEWHTSTGDQYTELEKTIDQMNSWEEELKAVSTQYQVLLKQIEDLTASAEKRRDELRGYTETGKVTAEVLIKSSEQHKELLKEINQTLGDSNRVGLAAAFVARKDELKRPQEAWQAIFICAIFCIVLAVWYFVIPAIGNGDTIMLAVEIALIAPLVWLGWFAAEQYSYTSKIREDYAFKAAAAMSYEGHKNAAREVGEDLERALLKISLKNISQNPIRLYGDGVHGTPIHKLADSITKTFFPTRDSHSVNSAINPSAQSPAAQTSEEGK